MPKLDKKGHEVLDDTPVAIPLRFSRPETLAEQVRSLLYGELSRFADSQGYETMEEADDFDVGDDFDPASPYEYDFDHIGEVHAGNQGSAETEERPLEKGTAQETGGVQQSGTGTESVSE